LGIDLGDDGVTLNDSGGHSGPNLLQNFPGLSSVISTNTDTTINGSLSAAPSTTYTLEFYGNSSADPSDYGEGQSLITSSSVTTDASGLASFAIPTPGLLAPGEYVTATATDPAGNTSEFSAAATVEAETTTGVQSSNASSVYGEQLTFTATVSTPVVGLPAPTGSVQFEVDGADYGSPVVVSGGSASILTSPLAVGSHTVTAVYSSDNPIYDSSEGDLTGGQTVSPADTSASLNSDVAAPVFGQPVTFTVMVSPVAPGAGIPSGDVTFYDGSITLGTASLDGTGTAIFTTSSLAVADHMIFASYAGDGNFNANTSDLLDLTVSPADTATALASSANPSALTQSITFTAMVSAVGPGSGTPSGAVQFQIDSVNFGSPVTLVEGKATSDSISSLSLGSHTISASYSGDGNFNASNAPDLAQTVQKDDTTTSLVMTVNPSVFGQSITYTASVASVPPGSGTPSGSVTFLDGSTVLGTSSLSSGAATFTTSALSVGTHSITAQYLGDAGYNPSVSAVLTQTVTQASTTTALTSSDNPSVFGQQVTFTATVSVTSPGSGTPTGTVTFYDGSTALGTATLNVAGNAIFKTKMLSVNTHSITATYGGDVHFQASTSAPLTQTVNKASTSTALSSSRNPSRSGQSVTFTATVSVNAPGGGKPTGTMTFYDGSTVLGSDTLSGGGKATFKTSTLAVGSHTITAVYAGDANFAGSTSPALVQVVQAAAPIRLIAAPSRLIMPPLDQIDEVLAEVRAEPIDPVLIDVIALEQILPKRRTAH
jgi:hypothetical protein